MALRMLRGTLVLCALRPPKDDPFQRCFPHWQTHPLLPHKLTRPRPSTETQRWGDCPPARLCSIVFLKAVNTNCIKAPRIVPEWNACSLLHLWNNRPNTILRDRDHASPSGTHILPVRQTPHSWHGGMLADGEQGAQQPVLSRSVRGTKAHGRFAGGQRPLDEQPSSKQAPREGSKSTKPTGPSQRSSARRRTVPEGPFSLSWE